MDFFEICKTSSLEMTPYVYVLKTCSLEELNQPEWRVEVTTFDQDGCVYRHAKAEHTRHLRRHSICAAGRRAYRTTPYTKSRLLQQGVFVDRGTDLTQHDATALLR